MQKQGKNREFSEISFSVYALFIKEKYDIVEYYKMEESANSDLSSCFNFRTKGSLV